LKTTWAALGVPSGVSADAGFGVQVAGTVRVNSGGGADRVGFELSTVAVDAIFATGGGNDLLLFRENTVDGNVSINTGAGRDVVNAASNTIGGRLTINLGGGNDRLRAFGNQVTGFGRLFGGLGFDVLTVGGINSFGNPNGLPIIRGFERRFF
jgi:Ca2+-binding RTX toxin-like protein